jgi:hypothetical protein
MYPFSKTVFKKACLFICFLSITYTTFSQQTDSTKHILNVKGSVSATNNGFSFIPSFSLGKPAVIFGFNVNSGKKLSFEPEFRFSLLDVKPWSFIFIWRYKLINDPKFQLVAGAHLPAIPFRTVSYVRNGVTYETLANYRFLPFELSPNFVINKNVSVGLFCLYAYGFEDAIRHTNFVALRSSISNINLSKNVSLRLNPQLFYLRLDTKEGYYSALNVTLAKKNRPFSLSAMMNKPLKTQIAGKDFDWNVGLMYNFVKTYVKQ